LYAWSSPYSTHILENSHKSFSQSPTMGVTRWRKMVLWRNVLRRCRSQCEENFAGEHCLQIFAVPFKGRGGETLPVPCLGAPMITEQCNTLAGTRSTLTSFRRWSYGKSGACAWGMSLPSLGYWSSISRSCIKKNYTIFTDWRHSRKA